MAASKAHKEDFASDSSVPERPLLPLTKRDNVPETKASSLGFLDGLRGVAALLVYQHHHITEYYGSDTDLQRSWGEQGRHHFAQLPFIQLFFSGGTPAVMIFFVLSGYVLSRGALKMLQGGKSTSDILQYLLNALLRRPIRLWLPPILVSLPVVFIFHSPLRPLGAFINYQPNIFLELKAYMHGLVDTINPFIDHGPFAQAFLYIPPVWTMAYELNGSVLVYVFMAVCGPYLGIRNRMIALTITLFIAFEYGHFSLVPFVLGIMLAQTDVSSLDKQMIERIPEHRRSQTFNAIFILGWLLLSDMGTLSKSKTPWFGLPGAWIPYFFYHNPNLATNIIGATCMVYASLRLSWLKQLFGRAQWLGRVSFALYLTHVPVIWIFAYRLRRCFGTPVPADQEKGFFDDMLPIPDIGPLGLTTRYLAMQLVILPFNLVLAEVVTVWIDETSVSVSKRFASRVMQRLHL